MRCQVKVFPIDLEEGLQKLKGVCIVKVRIAFIHLCPSFCKDQFPRLIEVLTPKWLLSLCKNWNKVIDRLKLVSSISIDKDLVVSYMW